MSLHDVFLVPADPQLSPDAATDARLRDRLAREPLAARLLHHDHVQFFDCGEGFESVACPRCHAEITPEWWGEVMDRDHDGAGFALASHITPCCGRGVALNHLVYRMKQGFGRFAITYPDPGGQPDPHLLADLAGILGCDLIAVHRHL